MSAPHKSERPAGAGRIATQTTNTDKEFRTACDAKQDLSEAIRAELGNTPALRVIEGEGYARAWLDRVDAGTAQSGELVVVLSFLTGEMLAGACRAIEKALGASHA
jgi:hypothetical protein